MPRLDLAMAGRTFSENADLVHASERSGWRGAWVSETAGADAVTTAAMAGSTLKSGRLGSAILPMQTRDPLLLAMTAASLARLSPGGFVLGLGTSTRVVVEDWHATPWGASPLELTRQCVDLTRRFLGGERITTTEGRWRYRRAQLMSPPAERVPIYIAALGDRMLELAGRIADGVILNFATVADLRHARDRVAAGALRAGRSLDDFEFIIYFRTTVTDEYEPVRRRYESELLQYLMAPVYENLFAREGYGTTCKQVQQLWRSGERAEALAAVPEELIRSRTLIGTSSQIRDRLAEYGEAGLDTAIMMPVPVPGRDYLLDCERTIEALAARAEPARERSVSIAS